jgi:hypothetical protein
MLGFGPISSGPISALPAVAFTGQTVVVGSAAEADAGTALSKAKKRVVGYPSETSAAFALVRSITVVTGQAAEADTAQTAARIKRRTLTQPVEADAAQAVSRAKTRAASSASETDAGTALALKAKARALGYPTGPDTATTLTKRSKTRALTYPTGTDTASPAVKVKARATGQAAEADTAQPVTLGERFPVGQAVEADTALAASRARTRLLTYPTESDTAQPVTFRETFPVGYPVEADSAQPLAKAKTRAVGYPTESDAGAPITRLHTRLTAPPSETDAGQQLAAKLKTRISASPAESDQAQPAVKSKSTATGTATETDAGGSVSRAKTRLLTYPTESDTAQPVTFRETFPVGQAVEADSASPVTAVRARPTGYPTEADIGVAVGRAKTRPLTYPTESDTGRPLAKAKVRVVASPTEDDTALKLAVTVITVTVIVGYASESDTAQPPSRLHTRRLAFPEERAAATGSHPMDSGFETPISTILGAFDQWYTSTPTRVAVTTADKHSGAQSVDHDATSDNAQLFYSWMGIVGATYRLDLWAKGGYDSSVYVLLGNNVIGYVSYWNGDNQWHQYSYTGITAPTAANLSFIGYTGSDVVLFDDFSITRTDLGGFRIVKSLTLGQATETDAARRVVGTRGMRATETSTAIGGTGGITNGSFENIMTDWTVSNPSYVQSISSPAHWGTRFAAIVSSGHWFKRTLTVTPGVPYTVIYWAKKFGTGNTTTHSVWLDGVDLTGARVVTHTWWAGYAVSFTPSTANPELKFSLDAADCQFGIDDVTVYQTDPAGFLRVKSRRPPGAVETDAARQLKPIIYTAASAELALPITVTKVVALGRTDEQDLTAPQTWDRITAKYATWNALLAAYGQWSGVLSGAAIQKSTAVGQATEVDEPQPVTFRETFPVGRGMEADSGQPVSKGKTRTVGYPTESDTARPVEVTRSRLLGQATEADAAQILTRSKARRMAKPIESDYVTGKYPLTEKFETPFDPWTADQRFGRWYVSDAGIVAGSRDGSNSAEMGLYGSVISYPWLSVAGATYRLSYWHTGGRLDLEFAGTSAQDASSGGWLLHSLDVVSPAVEAALVFFPTYGDYLRLDDVTITRVDAGRPLNRKTRVLGQAVETGTAQHVATPTSRATETDTAIQLATVIRTGRVPETDSGLPAIGLKTLALTQPREHDTAVRDLGPAREADAAHPATGVRTRESWGVLWL